MIPFGLLVGHLVGDYLVQNDWMAQNKTKRHLPCLVHCVLYTLSVWVCTLFVFPVWALAVTFGTHFLMDRYRLARRFMSISGQESFAAGPLSPWSIIAVDNTIHLLTLWVILLCL